MNESEYLREIAVGNGFPEGEILRAVAFERCRQYICELEPSEHRDELEKLLPRGYRRIIL